MKISLYLCLLSMLVLGCSSTVELQSADDANNKISDRSAILHLNSGQEYIGRDVQVGNDSVRMVNMETKDTLRFYNQDIKFLKVTNYKVGARDGFLIGGASLGTTVFTLGAIQIHSSDKPYIDRQLFTALTAIGAGLGGLVGLVIGAVSGHDYTYILPKDSVKIEIGTSIDSTNSSNHILLKSAP